MVFYFVSCSLLKVLLVLIIWFNLWIYLSLMIILNVIYYGLHISSPRLSYSSVTSLLHPALSGHGVRAQRLMWHVDSEANQSNVLCAFPPALILFVLYKHTVSGQSHTHDVITGCTAPWNHFSPGFCIFYTFFQCKVLLLSVHCSEVITSPEDSWDESYVIMVFVSLVLLLHVQTAWWMLFVVVFYKPFLLSV